ncbi:MAG: hypothetical protein QM704_20170 [Anaeromyxobacteraceae bacterium]
MTSLRAAAVAGLAAAVALWGAGCGNWSQEDVRFLAALPTRADLRVEVPASASAQAGALAACGTRPAALWLEAKPTSDGLNAAVDFVLDLVDRVRTLEPTTRTDDERVWGPWNDRNHPGFELLARIVRAAQGDLVVHAFSLEARRKGQGDFVPFISGTFRGPSAKVGTGTLEIDFEVLWTLGINDATTPRGALNATYDRSGDPRKVVMQVASRTALRPFEYRFEGYADGTGGFVYVIPSGVNYLEIASSFDGAGAGKAAITFHTIFATVGWAECWDAAACLTYVDDPGNYSCETEPSPPCSLGAASACPAVPAAP